MSLSQHTIDLADNQTGKASQGHGETMLVLMTGNGKVRG